jgi:hypothetical protein
MRIKKVEQVKHLDGRKKFLLEKILPKGEVCTIIGKNRQTIELLMQKTSSEILMGKTGISHLKLQPGKRKVFFMFTDKALKDADISGFDHMPKEIAGKTLGLGFSSVPDFDKTVMQKLKDFPADLFVFVVGCVLCGVLGLWGCCVVGVVCGFFVFAKKTRACIVFIQQNVRRDLASPICSFCFNTKNGTTGIATVKIL